MRRRRALVGLVALIVLTVLGWTALQWLFAPLPGLTKDNALRIQSGMSLAHVEALLGGTGIMEEPCAPGVRPCRWKTPDGALEVRVDVDAKDQVLYGGYWTEAEFILLPVDDSLFARLRRRFRM